MAVVRRFSSDPHSLWRSEEWDWLEEPTSFVCALCAEPVTGDLACQGCGGCHSHCPFCGNCQEPPCAHVLQEDGDEDFIFSVLTEMGVPDWPRDERWGRAEAAPHLEKAFGDLHTLVEDEEYGSNPYTFRYVLMPDLANRISAPVSVANWFCDRAMLAHGGSDYYTDQPEQARAELAAFVARLNEGFRLLGEVLSAGKS